MILFSLLLVLDTLFNDIHELLRAQLFRISARQHFLIWAIFLILHKELHNCLQNEQVALEPSVVTVGHVGFLNELALGIC